MCQQSTENLQTLLLTTDQLQCILNLSLDARAAILNKEQILSVKQQLEDRKSRLEAVTGSINNLPICETNQAIESHSTTSLITTSSQQMNSPARRQNLVRISNESCIN